MNKAAKAEEYAKQIKEAWQFGVLSVFGKEVQVSENLFYDIPGEIATIFGRVWTRHDKQYNGTTYFTLIKNKEGEENQAL
jgi:hypothetical protein